ncbi:MAG: outer membrane lipoprotein-sorting protein [Myxococcales bacterium]|nr:MAG: outer membrane lipoprotein-sorting protein [Myxococcales bacterium]
MRRCALFCALSLFAVLMLAPPVSARAEGPTALEILQKMDASISGYQDQEMDNLMTIVDVSGEQKTYEFTVRQKGERMRLIRFTTGELKGMAVLIEDRNRNYVYLPGYKRVRRVAAHNMSQPFAGSDFTQDDMATTKWADVCTPTIEREDEGYYYLSCPAKPEAKLNYARLAFKVDKKNFWECQVDYYDKDGKLVKVMENSDPFVFEGGLHRHRKVVLRDAITGHKTILDVKTFKVNQGFKDDQFTVRQLQWGK